MSECWLCYVYAFDIVHLVGFNKRIHWSEMHGMDNLKIYVVMLRNTEQPDFFAAYGWTSDDKWGRLLTVDSIWTQGTGMSFVVIQFSLYRCWGFKLAVQKPTLSTAVGTSESMAPTLHVRSVPHGAMYTRICLSQRILCDLFAYFGGRLIVGYFHPVSFYKFGMKLIW
jgi:CDP-diglyceride synthetase